MHRCTMSMRNTGASPLHNVRLIVSHPDVYCPTSDESLQEDVATALSGMNIGASPLHNVHGIKQCPDVYWSITDDRLQDHVAIALSGHSITDASLMRPVHLLVSHLAVSLLHDT